MFRRTIPTRQQNSTYNSNGSQITKGIAMTRFSAGLIILLSISLAIANIGCDTSADRELKRAEEALNAADAVDAEEHASEDYMKAEDFFERAMEANENSDIQEARRLAIQAKLRAEDATDKTKDRMRALEAENAKLGR